MFIHRCSLLNLFCSSSNLLALFSIAYPITTIGIAAPMLKSRGDNHDVSNVNKEKYMIALSGQKAKASNIPRIIGGNLRRLCIILPEL